MNTMTIIAPAHESSLSRVMEDVFACLRRQPEVPLALDFISQSIADADELLVEKAVKILEGPVPANAGEQEAYVHLCRCNRQAVYIA